MTRRAFTATVVLGILFIALPLSPPVGGQWVIAAQSAKVWTPPLLPDGRPDLEGFWTNDSYVPVERAPELGTKEFFTRDEAAAYFKQRVDRLLGQSKTDVHYDDALWQAENYSKEPSLRTSVVFNPRDGRLPPLTPEARTREAERVKTGQSGVSDSAQTRSLAERCISWGNVGPPMLPPTYNANFQIMQAHDQIIIRHEMMHDVRIVYQDGRHPSSTVRLLAGDSRGHWEGSTLVVDTTNFTGQTNFRGSPQTTRQDIFASEGLHVVERFTRTAADTIRYEFTVNDPKTWTAPWSGEMPLRRWPGPIYEYACHEGNYGLPNILRAARVQEANERESARRP